MRRQATFSQRNSKALGAISGAGIGGAIASILVFVIEANTEVDVPKHVVAEITVLGSALVAWLGAWWAPRNNYQR